MGDILVAVSHLWLEVLDHEAGKNSHHHLGLHLYDVFWQSVHSGTNLTRHGDDILRIAEFILQQ